MASLKFKHILAVFLVMAFLVSGLPRFVAEDVNRDRRIDLKDAVISAQALARLTLYADGETEGMGGRAARQRHEQVLQSAAGIKQVQHIDNQSPGFAGPDNAWLVSAVTDASPAAGSEAVTMPPALFSSYTPDMAPRPPNPA